MNRAANTVAAVNVALIFQATLALSGVASNAIASSNEVTLHYASSGASTNNIESLLRAATGGDFDGDGIPDAIDVDDDNDTILDDEEGTGDVDGDGIVNCLDVDSDNDGITDLTEALGSRGVLRLLDADGNGLLDTNVAVGENGLADIIEDGIESSQSTSGRGDVDGDGILDHQDLDTDNDGIPDVVEAGSSDTDRDGKYDFFRDLNGDGLADRLVATPILARDTDGDGQADYRDIDSDNDGLTDALETTGMDTDLDGQIDTFVDNNFDGLIDSYASQSNVLADTDQDGFPDYRDIDSDGDGVSDADEAFSMPVDSSPIVPEAPFNPQPQPSPQNVELVTGESGNVLGCSLSSQRSGRHGKATDLSMLLLFIFAVLVISRRWRSYRVLIPLSSAVFISSCSSLQGVATEADVNSYAGVGLGASFLNANTRDLPLEQDTSYSAAAQLTLGVNITPQFAIEARAADLGELTFTNGAAVGYQVADVSAIGKFNLERLTGFARVGAGALFNDGDIPTSQDNPTHLLLGAGADYRLSPNWSLRAEWQGHDVDVMHSQFSVLYRFGNKRSEPPLIIATDRREPVIRSESSDETEQELAAESANTSRQTENADQSSRNASAREPALSNTDTNSRADVSVGSPSSAPERVSNQTSDDNLASQEINVIVVEGAEKEQVEPETQLAAQAGNSSASASEPQRKEPEPEKIVAAPADKDKDGIVDASDKCPGTVAGAPVLGDGCSLFAESVSGLTFNPGTDELTASALSVLDSVADVLGDKTDIRMTIAAHTAPAEDAQSAMFLTRRRTIAIIRYLSDKGIDAARLRPEAFGDTQPMAGVSEPEANDRVVFTRR